METGITSILCMKGKNKPLGTLVPVSHERVKIIVLNRIELTEFGYLTVQTSFTYNQTMY